MNPTTLAQKILALDCKSIICENPTYDPWEDFLLGCKGMREKAADLATAHDAERDELVEVARKAHDAAWSATSKLESQINRNSDVPAAYKTIMQESFDALRELSAVLARVKKGKGE